MNQLYKFWNQLNQQLIVLVLLVSNLCLSLIIGGYLIWQHPQQPRESTRQSPVMQNPTSQPVLTTPTPASEEQPSEVTEPLQPQPGNEAMVNGKININTAASDLLMELPGIGPQKAQAIIDYRTQTPFSVIADIQKVSGIGEKTFTKIQEMIMCQ